jgi:hypothetical protein
MKSKSSELLFLTFFISVVSAFAAVPNVIRYNAGTVSNLEAQKIKIDRSNYIIFNFNRPP